MRRRSKASGEPAKPRRGKTVTLKRGNAPKAVRRCASSTTSQETKVARLIRERDEALERQAATADENGRLLNELREALRRLEQDLGDIQDVEFTIENHYCPVKN